MSPFQRIGCLVGRHKRNGHLVKHDGKDFRSVCAGCGKPMIRDLHGWTLVHDNQSDDPSASSH